MFLLKLKHFELVQSHLSIRLCFFSSSLVTGNSLESSRAARQQEAFLFIICKDVSLKTVLVSCKVYISLIFRERERKMIGNSLGLFLFLFFLPENLLSLIPMTELLDHNNK